MSTEKKISPIYALDAPFTGTAGTVDVFDNYGASHDGNHIVIFFRPVVETELLLDHKNPLTLNRFCRMYNIVNQRGSVYGHLFSVSDTEKLTLTRNRLVVRCNKHEKFDFSQLPINSEKQKLALFKSSSGCVLALSGHADSDYLVYEPS